MLSSRHCRGALVASLLTAVTFAHSPPPDESSVKPDTWIVNGGTGTIGAFSDSLVVSNSVRVHRTLSRLLNDLRAAEVENADRKTGRRPARP